MQTLLLVDLQYDFLPGGALAVRDGDRVLPVALELMTHFDFVVASQDWHPADHMSFATQHPGRKIGEVIELEGLPQVLWPEHCVQGSRGAELHDSLDQRKIDRIFRKGTNRAIDSYSTFFDNDHRQSTGLADYLRERGVRRVYIAGLATDYCVKFSALDACELGYETYLIQDGCRGVELAAGDVAAALREMEAAGVVLSDSRSFREQRTEIRG